MNMQGLFTISPLSSLPPSDAPVSSPSPASSPSPIPALSLRPTESVETLVDADPVNATSGLDSNGMIPTSPITGKTRAEKRQNKLRKQRKYRLRHRLAHEATLQAQLKVQANMDKLAREELLETKTNSIEQILRDLDTVNLTIGDLLLHVSDPANNHGWKRWGGLFSVPGRIEAVLDLWVSSRNSTTGRKAVHDWATAYISAVINREANKVKNWEVLHTRSIDATFGMDFNLMNIYARLRTLCPTTTVLLQRVSTTDRQERTMRATSRAKKDKIVGAVLAMLLGTRSQRNSYLAQIIGLYLYATGAQRQVITVLSHFGLCSSYVSLAGSGKSIRQSSLEDEIITLPGTTEIEAGVEESSNRQGEAAVLSDDSELEYDDGNATGQEEESDRNVGGEEEGWEDEESIPSSPSPQARDVAIPTKRPPRKAKRGEGLLHRLSRECRDRVRSHAETGRLGIVYDNINYRSQVAEQTVGRQEAQENGTCATAFILHGAQVESMRTDDLVEAFDHAHALQRQDLLLSSEENREFRSRLEHVVMRTIVEYAGEAFHKFKNDIEKTMPRTAQAISLHKSDIFPLPAMDIDEASTSGNADVLDAIDTEIHSGADLSHVKKVVKIYWGDQLSVARCRTVVNTRAGHDIPLHSYLNAAFAPGFFHYQMTATHSLLDIHWGEPGQGARNPGSLLFHNTVLTRRPITISAMPPYRTCRDLIFVSLYARVLHCFEIVTGFKDLELAGYVESMTFEDLHRHAKEIVSRFADAEVAGRLRTARHADLRMQSDGIEDKSDEQPKSNEGDMVFENAVLFLRDALILREFTDAIKSGDVKGWA